MEADWDFDDDVKMFINQIKTGLKYATFTRSLMNNQEPVAIAIMIVLKTGLFREAYVNWNAREPDQ